MTRRHLGLVALLALAASLGSCSSRLGWGVVLWTAAEGPIPAGSIVPVYIKSNIQKVYVVGVPAAKGKEKGRKLELPFWQVELYPTRGKAAARVKAMGGNVSLYMVAARDGLPLRDKPANTAKRVFRLREGQSVKILEKAEGDEVNTGGQALAGAWYLVLADDGTTGYAFSYAFRLYDESKEGPPVLASAKAALSGRVDLVFSRSWRPEYFQEMLDDNRIDLDYFSLRYGIFVDAIRRQIRLELPAASQVFNYTGISEAKGLYVFEGTPLKIKIESDTRMVCSWTGPVSYGSEDRTDDVAAQADAASQADAATQADAVAAAAATAAATATQADETSAAVSEGAGRFGSGGSEAFVVLAADPTESIRHEELRQRKLLADFIDVVGSDWAPPSGSSAGAAEAGRLSLTKNGRFTWSGRGAAAAALIPAGAGDGGEVAMRLFLDPALRPAWDGAVSFLFDQASDDAPRQKWVDFLYRRGPTGLVLAPAVPPSGLLVQAAVAAVEPLVLAPAAK
jgi:hypothetical protein